VYAVWAFKFPDTLLTQLHKIIFPFNNPEVVRPSTRARIEIAARELGYIRDRMAGVLQALRVAGITVPAV
jgi:hypothetical protein